MTVTCISAGNIPIRTKVIRNNETIHVLLRAKTETEIKRKPKAGGNIIIVLLLAYENPNIPVNMHKSEN